MVGCVISHFLFRLFKEKIIIVKKAMSMLSDKNWNYLFGGVINNLDVVKI